MIKSKSKIEKQIERKTNSELVETIILAKKNPKWLEVASLLSGPNKKRKNANISEIEKVKSEIIVVCGKVLSLGEINSKKKVVALGFSEVAKEKLLKAGCSVELLKNEILKNKDAKGVIILK